MLGFYQHELATDSFIEILRVSAAHPDGTWTVKYSLYTYGNALPWKTGTFTLKPEHLKFWKPINQPRKP